MAGVATDPSTPSRAVALGWVGLILAAVMPLLASTTDAPATSGLVCVALAVLAFAGVARDSSSARSAQLLPQRVVAAVRTEPHRGGQATDTTHHPLRPRAPGLV